MFAKILPMAARRKRAHRVAAAVGDGVTAFELGVACEVFGLDRSWIADPWYEFAVCAFEPPPLRCNSGFLIDTPHGVEWLAEADTIICTHWRDPAERPPEPLLEAIRAAHQRGARLLSVCSGAFVHAHAGVLDGRRATTHWIYTDELARRFPAVDVVRDVLYVIDDDVMTSAGTAAGIDLCLHVVRSDHGAEAATALARRMVVPPHRDGGQAQFVEAPVPACSDSGLAAVMDWAVAHLDQPLPVDVLADRAGTSPRSFARRFREATGTTPHQWVTRQRVLHAQRLLESSERSIDEVAQRCGFGSAAALRLHFQRVLHTTPTSYRRAFALGEPA
jgi:AraC family transcriptional regulator, transcriptional activator FtrA